MVRVLRVGAGAVHTGCMNPHEPVQAVPVSDPGVASGVPLLGWLPVGRCQQDGTLMHVSAVRASGPVMMPALMPADTEVDTGHACGVPAAAHPDPAAIAVHG